MKILIAEDEPNIASFEKLELEHEGYEVFLSTTGRDAVTVFEESLTKEPSQQFSIVLLDIMLPGLNGIEVLRRIRKVSNVPVILVTARGETYDKVTGLDAGADDYISKPFAIEELLARIRSVLRRTETHPAEIEPAASSAQVNDAYQLEEHPDLAMIHFERLSMNTLSLEVFMDKDPINLTKTEFMLLKCLLLHQGEVLNREAIITQVWGNDHFIDANSVDVYIRYLRSKIDDVYEVNYITTVRGTGYTIRNNAADD